MANRKMLIAPVLAVALVLSLAATVIYLPVSSMAASQNKPSSQPTATPYYYNMEPAPTTGSAPSGTAPPTAIPAPAALRATVNPLPILSIIAAAVIGIIAVLILFREKSLKKELSQ